MKMFEIKTSFSIYATFKVPADTFDEALGKLCNKELLTEYSGCPSTWGFDERNLDDEGITVEVENVDGDPSPTGDEWTQRKWEYQEESEDEDGSQ